MQRNNTFPIYRHWSKGGLDFIPVKGFEEYSTKVAKRIIKIVDQSSPTLFDVENVKQYLDGRMLTSGKISDDDLGLNEIPSVPPFSVVWIELIEKYNTISALLIYKTMGLGEWECIPLIQRAEGFCVLPIMITLNFNEDGINTEITTQGESDYKDHLSYETVTDAFVSTSMVALTAFAFSHCKNVDIVEHLPRRHEQREARRKGEPILKYHEIVIDPSRTYANSETVKTSTNKPTKALHIARGHFAHYSEEKPLFGKYAGTFWIPAHVRGSADNGVVKSTYKVKAA